MPRKADVVRQVVEDLELVAESLEVDVSDHTDPLLEHAREIENELRDMDDGDTDDREEWESTSSPSDDVVACLIVFGRNLKSS